MKIPDKQYIKKVNKIITSKDLLGASRKYNYYSINEKINDSLELESLVKENVKQIYKISAGTSDRNTFARYKEQAINAISMFDDYRWYAPPLGSEQARQALAKKENLKLNKLVYNSDDFCLTEGVSGAISMIYEYISRDNVSAEVVVISPSYYLFKSLANYYNLKVNEVFDLDCKTNNIYNQVESKLTKDTKLIVLNQPNNPTGKLYEKELIEKLLCLCKKKGILLLVDELFNELLFEGFSFIPSDLVASRKNALNNLVIVNGYSKSKNLAGLRIGFAYSKNKFLLKNLEKISEFRQCFPGASNYHRLIILDSFIESYLYLSRRTKWKIERIIHFLKDEFSGLNPISSMSNKELTLICFEYTQYVSQLMEFYSENYDKAVVTLRGDIIKAMPKISAFNTFIKLNGLDEQNMFDFCLNLFLLTGVKTQIGPCFGLNQDKWEKDPDNLGFWLRLTFAREQNEFLEGLILFKEFKAQYAKLKPHLLITNKLF